MDIARHETLLTLSAEIVSSYLANNNVGVNDVPALISSVHVALVGLEKVAATPSEALRPAVSVRASVKPDYIACLECGRKAKMLKRHLQSAHGLTPDEYRAKWGLPRNYPMTAALYSDTRRGLAISAGLGRKKGERVKRSKPTGKGRAAK